MLNKLEPEFVEIVHRSHVPSLVTCEKREDGGGDTIAGLAAVFYDGTRSTEYELWDDTFERIMPTAFDRAIREDDVRGLFNHNPDKILGRTTANTMQLTKTPQGLAYRIDAPPSAEPIMQSIKRGDVSGSSFSFTIDPGTIVWKQEKIDDKRFRTIREIHAVHLFDVGPVTFPAYTSTTASASGDGPSEARSSYDAWRAEQGRARGQAARRRGQRTRTLRLLEMAESM